MAPAAPAIPGYRILRLLGQGGMGAVYLVEPEELPGTTRALKVLPAQDGTRRARFLREAELLARVEGHPALARIHAVGEHRGQPWMVMEYVDGEDLARLGARCGPSPWPEAFARIATVADGLARVHALGVLHRDIKPANVVVERPGTPAERVVLIDFGVATAVDLERLTRTGVVVGTPQYLSPEAARGEPLDARSDVYALGATLFELLTGQPLFDGETVGEVFAAVLADAPRAPSAEVAEIPRAVDALVLRAVAKDPARRPRDAAELASELRRLLANPPGERTWQDPARAAAVAVTVAALGVAAVAWPSGSAPPSRPATSAATVSARPVASAAPTRSPLLDSILIGSGEALRAVKLARDGRIKASLVDDAVDERLRAEALVAARVRPLDVKPLVEWLEATGVVRDAFAQAGRTPPRDVGEVVDAALQGVEGLLPDPSTMDTHHAVEACKRAGRVFTGLAASRLRSGDRIAAETLVERVGTWILNGAVGGTLEQKDHLGVAYDDIQMATVDLDIDIDGSQLRQPDAAGPRGYQADVISARVALVTPRSSNEPHPALRAIELERTLAGKLGPVTRARLLASLPKGELAETTLARLRRAKELDPESPFVRMVLAQVLHVMKRPEEAAAEIRVALDGKARRDEMRGAGMRFRDVNDFEESCFRIFIDADAFEDAERILEAVEPSDERDELLQELARARAQHGVR